MFSNQDLSTHSLDIDRLIYSLKISLLDINIQNNLSQQTPQNGANMHVRPINVDLSYSGPFTRGDRDGILGFMVGGNIIRTVKTKQYLVVAETRGDVQTCGAGRVRFIPCDF